MPGMPSNPDAAWIHVWPMYLENVEDLEVDLLDVLGLPEQDAANRFRFSEHRLNYIKRRAFYRNILSLYTGENPRTISFSRTAKGKPFLPSNRLDFSTSSSGQYALIAVSNFSVGIDIERHRESLCGDRSLGDQFLSHPEIRRLETAPESAKCKLLFDYWTLKEAYLKGIGTGLLVDPRKIAFDIDTKTFLKAAAAKPRPERNWNFRQPELVTNYSMAVATNRKGAELEIVTAAMSTDSKIRLIS